MRGQGASFGRRERKRAEERARSVRRAVQPEKISEDREKVESRCNPHPKEEKRDKNSEGEERRNSFLTPKTIRKKGDTELQRERKEVLNSHSCGTSIRCTYT